MTISLTPEEVRTYQDSVRKWADAKATFLSDLLTRDRVKDMSVERFHKLSIREEATKWDNENPCPQLFPRI